MKHKSGRLGFCLFFLVVGQIYESHSISFGGFHFGGGGRPMIRRSRPPPPNQPQPQSQLQSQPQAKSSTNQRQQSQWSSTVQCGDPGHTWSDCRTALKTRINPTDWLEGDGSRPVTQQRSRSRAKGPQAASSNSHLQYLMAPWLDVGEDKPQQAPIKMVHHYDERPIVHNYHHYVPAHAEHVHGSQHAAQPQIYLAPESVPTKIKSYEVASPQNAVWSDYPLEKQNPDVVTAYKAYDDYTGQPQPQVHAVAAAVEVAPPPTAHYQQPIQYPVGLYETPAAAAVPVVKSVKSAHPIKSKDTYSIFVVEPPSKGTQKVQHPPAANIFRGYEKYLTPAASQKAVAAPAVTSVYAAPHGQELPQIYHPLVAPQSYAQINVPQQLSYLDVLPHPAHHHQVAFQQHQQPYVLNPQYAYAAQAQAHLPLSVPIPAYG